MKILVELATPVAVQVATAVVVATMFGRSTEHVPKRTWLIPVPPEPILIAVAMVVVPLIVVRVDDAWLIKPVVKVARPPIVPVPVTVRSPPVVILVLIVVDALVIITTKAKEKIADSAIWNIL